MKKYIVFIIVVFGLLGGVINLKDGASFIYGFTFGCGSSAIGIIWTAFILWLFDKIIDHHGKF